jgi:hypothetical protein
MDDLIDSWNRILTLGDIGRNVASRDAIAPTTAARLCWHCCHPWNGDVITYPFSYDNKTGKFKTGGQFCSWECVKGYSRDTMSRVLSGVHQVNIRHYRKMLTNKTDHVMPAPPKIILKAFGGHLDIDDFRTPNKSNDYIVNYALKTEVIAYRTLEYNTEEKNITKSASDRPLTIQSSGVENEHLRLRRTKPLAHGRPNIERTLGLNTFANFIRNV